MPVHEGVRVKAAYDDARKNEVHIKLNHDQASALLDVIYALSFASIPDSVLDLYFTPSDTADFTKDRDVIGNVALSDD